MERTFYKSTGLLPGFPVNKESGSEAAEERCPWPGVSESICNYSQYHTAEWEPAACSPKASFPILTQLLA